MKKTIYMLIILLLLFSGNVFASEISIQEKIERGTYISPEKGNEITFTDDDIKDWRKESKKRKETFEKVPEIWFERYKSDSVPENERIKEYLFSGYSNHQIIDGKLKASISVMITPYSENSIWNDFSGQIYAEFGIDENGEYMLEKASIYPPNYDKFVERFEEYKKSNTDENIVEKSEIQAKKQELENSQIKRTSNLIFIASLIIFVIVITTITVKIVKRRNV